MFVVHRGYNYFPCYFNNGGFLCLYKKHFKQKSFFLFNTFYFGVINNQIKKTMNEKIPIDILRGYKIYYYPNEKTNKFNLEWTAYREESYLNNVRWLIDGFNKLNYEIKDAKFIIDTIKKFL